MAGWAKSASWGGGGGGDGFEFPYRKRPSTNQPESPWQDFPLPPPIPSPQPEMQPFPTPWSKEDMWEAENRMRDPNYPRMPRTIPGAGQPYGPGQAMPTRDEILGQASPWTPPPLPMPPKTMPAMDWRGAFDMIRQFAQGQTKKKPKIRR